MKSKIFWWVCGAAALSFSGQAFAQEVCATALNAQAFNKRSNQTSQSIYMARRDDVCNATYSSLSEARSKARSFGFDAVIEAVPIGLNGSSTGQSGRVNISQTQFCQATFDDLASTQSGNFFEQVTDTALEVWRDCVETTNQNRLWLEYSLGDNGKNFSGTLIKTANTGPLNGQVTSLLVVGAARNGVRCQIGAGGEFGVGPLDNPVTISTTRTAISCEKTGQSADQHATITIQTGGDSLPPIPLISVAERQLTTADELQRQIDALSRATVQNERASAPVGTIISSPLSFAELASAVGDPAAFDPQTSKWAPADGREIADSDLAQFRIRTPDLRGQFIRGLNVFYAEGEPDEITNGEDAGERNLLEGYSYQDGSAGRHTHTVYGVNYKVSTYSTNNNQGRLLQTMNNDDRGNYTEETGEGVADEGGVRPPNVAMNYYIRINR